MPRKKSAQKSSAPTVNFSPKLQIELESLITDTTNTKLEGVRGKVFQDRYSLKDSEGKAVEKYPEQMWSRIAAGIAQMEKTPAKRKEWAKRFYNTLKDFKFVPGGRVLSGAGTDYDVTYYNCFVIPSPHDSRDGIIDNLKIMVDIMSRSGGVGINLSSLRPRGARVKKVNGWSSGPVVWAELYSTATHDVIQQGGTRRGALMLMINDWHPDLLEFIEVKKDLSKINGANLSICISDAFMKAVKEGKNWQLVFPDITDPEYDEVWDGDIEKWKAVGKKVIVSKSVKAAEVWDKICQAAWNSAEPGTHFIQRSNERSNTWYFEKLICTNPCGEQPLGAWAVCNLGAMNLAAFVKGEAGEGELDYDALAEHVKIAIRFMDDVVDATGYYFEENKKQQMGIRRTGLGTLGLGDALIKMGVRYGGTEALPVVEKIYKTIRDAAYEESTDLATEKGSFPKFDKKKYLQGWFIKRLPQEIQAKISSQGIRNAVLLTQAPTGTTSLVSGVSSGMEPVYDFAMIRRDRTGEHVMYHPLYREWQEKHPDQPHPGYFVSANDLTPEEHVRMQAAIQEYTDSSISKTVNAPNSHSVADVKKLYTLAYELGCKGVTYMRDGSRVGVLSHMGSEQKEKQTETVNGETKPNGETPNIKDPVPVYLRRRTDHLQGITRKMPTPVGDAFITINADDAGNPFEVFINIGKAGSDIKADAEAVGRLISLALRIPSDFPPKRVMEKIVNQLEGIGGATQMGFGNKRIYSMADAVAKVLNDYLEEQKLKPIVQTKGNGEVVTSGNGQPVSQEETSQEKISEPEKEKTQPLLALENVRRDICPKCGAASFVNEEGCKKCYSCAYSEC
ncbi:adenosylcobalamin-dependent ribonucleoside-diphosphate reductase [Patescibacteria group bacterium]|nr:adenosylcobalamin-dependent ribonucleoside-diphosphate reductase [Patescibacteria group bacterium]